MRGNGLRSLDANIFSSLSALEVLYLGDSNILSSLDADIFSNLSALEELYLNDNDLSSLDANIFSNLSALKTLWLNRKRPQQSGCEYLLQPVGTENTLAE